MFWQRNNPSFSWEEISKIDHIAVHFFNETKILDFWSQRCHTRGVENWYVGVKEKSGALCRCKIRCRIHFSHRILSPLPFCLPLERLKIWNMARRIFGSSKGRQNARGDKIRCEKWISDQILHRHSAPRFLRLQVTAFLELRACGIWGTSLRLR